VINWRTGPSQPLGVKDGRLAACSNRPNCVSSQTGDPDHAIDPIAFSLDSKAAQQLLKQQVLEMPRTKLVEESGDYLRFEVSSLFFRFVDDLEFVVEPNVIQVRSASRVGQSDLGVNRQRVEKIRRRFQKENMQIKKAL
jgi:uncharacterized protein (DUF1499 family)